MGRERESGEITKKLELQKMLIRQRTVSCDVNRPKYDKSQAPQDKQSTKMFLQ